MQAKNAHDVALETLSNLTKMTDEYGNYLHMQVSFSDHARIYICLCPMIKDRVIIHEEFDDSKLDDTRVIPIKFDKSYLESYDTITFVGLREDPKSDQMIVMYKK